MASEVGFGALAVYGSGDPDNLDLRLPTDSKNRRSSPHHHKSPSLDWYCS